MAASPRDVRADPALGSEARALVAALSLFAGILAFVGSCGSDALTFPGNVVQTETPQFTDTPAPTSTVTP